MTKEQGLASCKGFDLANSILSLWVFKKRQAGGFTAKSIEITPALSSALKSIVSSTLEARTEVDDYSLVALINEVGCLHVGTDETCFSDLKALVDEPAEEHRIQGARDLKNLTGYLIRLRANGNVLYCVKQVPNTWQTKKANTVVNVVMRAHQLDIVDEPSFTISKSFDFITLDNDLFILNKRAFEALLSYKIEYANSFSALQQDANFTTRFTDLQPFLTHVGSNTMHLRRMAVIQQRAHYTDQAYMDRLRDVNTQEGWNIQFDPTGKIIATEDTMKVIMQVLLNHRLYSRLSLTTFDVPSTAAV